MSGVFTGQREESARVSNLILLHNIVYFHCRDFETVDGCISRGGANRSTVKRGKFFGLADSAMSSFETKGTNKIVHLFALGR